MKFYLKKLFIVTLSTLFIMHTYVTGSIVNDDFSVTHAFNSGVENTVDEKVYINPWMLQVVESGIFLYLREEWVQIQSVSHDEQGIFVFFEEIQAALWGDTWICPNRVCGYVNYEGIDTCPLCGTKKLQKDV